MRDCVNAEMRDRLPELVHGRLEGPEHAAVESHVAECPDCAAEAALIRLAASTVALAAPKMNAASIASRIPHRPTAVQPSARSILRNGVFRWAAALLVIATGMGVLQVTRSGTRQEVASVGRTLPESGERALAQPITGGGPTMYATVPGRSGLVLVGGIDVLTIDEIEALVSGVETLSYMPAADPDPMVFTAAEEVP